MPTPLIDRSWAYSQLQQNPALLRRLADMVKGEVGLGRDPTLERIQLESAFNRAQARGIPLTQALKSVADGRGGYYASDTYSRPANPSQLSYFQDKVLQPVLSGSNTSQDVLGFPATGNASGTFAARRAANGVYGTAAWYSGKPLNGEMFVVEKPDLKFAQNLSAPDTQVAQNALQYADNAPQGQNIPQGKDIFGKPWNFPAMRPATPFDTSSPANPDVPANLPPAAPTNIPLPGAPVTNPAQLALNPPSVTVNPFGAAGPDLGPAPALPGGAPPSAPAIQVAQNTPQIPQAPQMPQGNGLLGGGDQAGGANIGGILGALGGLSQQIAGQQQQAPAFPPPQPVHPQVNLQPLIALLQNSPLRKLSSGPSAWSLT